LLLDIGANIGYVSACFLMYFNGAHIIAIEPQRDVLHLLQKNLRQFGCERFEIVPFALSDRDGVAHFQICKRNKGASKIVTRSGPETSVVQVISAESLLAGMERSPDLIKVDVEGHEYTILAAILPKLDQAPRAIIYEDQERQSCPTGPL